MTIRCLLAFPMLAIVTACASIENRDGRDTECDRHPACVKIIYPDDLGQPDVSQHSLDVNRPVGGGPAVVAFMVAEAHGKDTRITFKCQREADRSGRVDADCRTPLKNQGTEQWTLNVPADGRLHTATIPRHLRKCDEICEPGQRNCAERHCRYEYMVQDQAGNHIPLDPDMIIDPR